MKFYIYKLVDPRNGEPFYIGKGQGNRMYAHEKQARTGVESRKCDLIRELIEGGHEIVYAIDSRHSDETAAYAREKALVEQIGLKNLTNMVPGGGGVWPVRIVTPTWRTDKVMVPALADILKRHARGYSVHLGPLDLVKMAKGTFIGLIERYGVGVVATEFARFNVRIA
jgi:Uncharacterized protein conserved in bacteria